MKRHIFLLILLSFVLSSCYTTKLVVDDPQIEDEHIGLTYASIIDRYGAPDRTTPDGRGGTILIYETITNTSNGYITEFGDTGSKSYRQAEEYLHLYVGPDNYCYKTRSQYGKRAINIFDTVTAGLVGLGTIIVMIAIAGS